METFFFWFGALLVFLLGTYVGWICYIWPSLLSPIFQLGLGMFGVARKWRMRILVAVWITAYVFSAGLLAYTMFSYRMIENVDQAIQYWLKGFFTLGLFAIPGRSAIGLYRNSYKSE